MSKTTRGIYFAIIASISVAVMGVFVKFIAADVNNLTIVYFRFAISLLILLPFLYHDKNFSFKIKFPVLLTARVLCGVLAITTYFFAIQHIELVNAILLQGSYPIFVPIVIFLLTGRKTNRKVLWGILISFIGIILVLHPGSDIFQPYSLVALISGICASISFVLLRIMLGKDKKQMKNLLFYFFLFGTLILLPYTIITWKPLTPVQWLCLLGIGIFGYGYQFFQTKALQIASVRIVSPLTYIAVIVGGYLDWLIWDIGISYITLIGITVTIAGAIIVIFNRSRTIL